MTPPAPEPPTPAAPPPGGPADDPFAARTVEDAGRTGPFAPPAGAPAAALPSVPGYELLGVLGRGGMGVVYRARQIGLNRLVALKMVLAGVHAGPGAFARFLAVHIALSRGSAAMISTAAPRSGTTWSASGSADARSSRPCPVRTRKVMAPTARPKPTSPA